MKKLLAMLLISTVGVLPGYAVDSAGEKAAATKTAEASKRADRLKTLNDAALAVKAETREELAALGDKLGKDIKALEVDGGLLKAARDKSLDWKTRFLMLEHVERGAKNKITKDEELSLYSDILQDGGEHKENRKRAAQALMEPSRTEPKARKALEKAAKDKALPAEVLWSVMVSVGSSGMDDVDTLTELMKRPAKTNNEIGINLNAVRALGQSKDPRAVGMLFKILDESHADSFFNMTALEQFSFMIRRGPEQMEKLRPMLTPRLLKLLDNRSRIGASRQMAARMLLRMRERKAIPLVIKWLKPQEEGGGGSVDAMWAADILAEFQAKEAIPEIQKVLDNFAADSRWEPTRRFLERHGGAKFPEGAHGYIKIGECLKKLKGEKYNKKYVSLPWKYD